jgi:HNH endonuclease
MGSMGPSQVARNLNQAARRARTSDLGVLERIGSHIVPQANGCWLYQGKVDEYARAMGFGVKDVYVHRFVYEVLVEPVPKGWHVHHKCETPGCCNPEHLVAVSPAEHRRLHSRP